jgi:acid phosphatase type 7
MHRGSITIVVLAAAAMLPTSAAGSAVGGASYSGKTSQKELIAITVARSTRNLSRFDAVVRATCTDRQRDWTHFVLPRGDSSFAVKRGRIAKRISLSRASAPASGELSVTVRFGRKAAVTGSLAETWHYGDGTTCTSGNVTFRLRRGRYAPPRDPREPRPTHSITAPPTPIPGLPPPPAPPPVPPPPQMRTAPVVAVAGDIGVDSPAPKGTARVVESLNPDLVLTTGDNAYPNGTNDEFARFYAPTWGAFKAKTRPSPGNHDYNTPGAAGYFDYFNGAGRATGPAGARGEGYYSFDLGSWHLIALNNYVPTAMGSAQEQWLKADLAATTRPCIAAYWHAPRWTSSAVHRNNPDAAPLWDDLYAARADVVLNGHVHSYERFARQSPSGQADTNGIREFVVGTGGAGFYAFGQVQPNSLVRDASSHGVLELILHANSYHWNFRPSDGTFTDSGTTECH